MCLTSIKRETKIAENDIVCYKILEKTKDEKYPYKTPYQDTPVSREIINGTQEFIGLGNRDNKHYFITSTVISEGYIHTFKFPLIAIDECKRLLSCFGKEYCLYECIIPKSTKYYEGFNDQIRTTYASEKIKFIKKMNL